MAIIAKKSGSSVLFPEGCSTLQEIPWELQAAISHAYSVLAWHESRPSEKIPPRWMWPHDEELEKFFERVDDKDGGPPKDEEDEGAFRNEYADRFR